MTEEEAKTKWCPFARVTPDTDDYEACTNRGRQFIADRSPLVNEAANECKCLASACMAWRSHGPFVKRETSMSQAQPPGEGWERAGGLQFHGFGATNSPEYWSRGVELAPAGGFCGLAGQPA